MTNLFRVMLTIFFTSGFQNLLLNAFNDKHQLGEVEISSQFYWHVSPDDWSDVTHMETSCSFLEVTSPLYHLSFCLNALLLEMKCYPDPASSLHGTPEFTYTGKVILNHFITSKHSQGWPFAQHWKYLSSLQYYPINVLLFPFKFSSSSYMKDFSNPIHKR